MDIIKYLEGRQEYLKAKARRESLDGSPTQEKLAQAKLSEVSTLLYVLKVPEKENN